MTTPDPSIPFIDLRAQQSRIRERIDAAVKKVLDHGQYILGPEVTELENKLAEFTGAEHVVSCGSGTDALLLALMARGVGPGDAVFVPSFTFVATAEVVAVLGATPVFVDVDEDAFLMEPDSLKEAIESTRNSGLDAKGIIPVDLFGQPADYQAINEIAATEDLFVLDDAAQSFGADHEGRRIGSLAPVTATSFFPAKPLGCYGDGGAIFTDDADMAATLRSLRVHGEGQDKYDNVRIGLNGRLDSIQAAVLLEKLAIYEEEIKARHEVADFYRQGLSDIVKPQLVVSGSSSVWAQYTILVDHRDAVSAALKNKGIPTAVYYPTPLHRQTAYAHYPASPDGLPVSDALADKVLSLPMHPYLEPQQLDRIVSGVRDAVAETS